MYMMGGWMQQTTMAHVYLCNNPALSAHVPQNLKYNFFLKKENNLHMETLMNFEAKLFIMSKIESQFKLVDYTSHLKH